MAPTVFLAIALLCHHSFTVAESETHGNLRLVGGSNYKMGRVEIFIEPNNTWGTICDDGWDDQDAQVVCRQLGFGTTGTATLGFSLNASPTVPIWLDNVTCNGLETSLIDCQHNGLGIHNCNHRKDAGVTCEGKVRLVNGPTEYEGRVEVYYNGTWGKVCDDGWDLSDAQVVCAELGLGKATAVLHSSFYGQSSGEIWLDNVNCVGTEETIGNCPHGGWGHDDCYHGEDAGVKCSTVRLANGSTKYEGRVEVYHNGVWGTVCNGGWDLNDAQVVCREMMFGHPVAAANTTFYGKGIGQIWLDDLNCVGTEGDIGSCVHRGWGIHNCSHNNDTGVNCTIGVAVRLVGGNSYNKGRVEVNYNGEWGSVCNDGWNNIDAGVVCRQLGFGTTGLATRPSSFGQAAEPILLDKVACDGSESMLERCNHAGFGVPTRCTHSSDAGVRCLHRQGIPVRLVGGSSYNEGRVEVYYNGQWGTVCDDGWDDTDASVVCRQLGFGSLGMAIGSAGFGQRSGSIWLGNVMCSGSESTLASCGHPGVGFTSSCYHFEDAGVKCREIPQTHYYLGFFENLAQQSTFDNYSIILTTSETNQVHYSMEAPSVGYYKRGTILAGDEAIFYLPSNIDVSSRDHEYFGIHLTTSSSNVTVIGQSLDFVTGDSFFALPIIELDDVYIYYGISVPRARYDLLLAIVNSSILVVGTEDNTMMNLTTTQSVNISIDNTIIHVTSGVQYSLVINRLQAIYIGSLDDLSGTKIVTNKPVSVFSGHECANVPWNIRACSYLIEQIPPTALWGKAYYTVPLAGKRSYTVKILAAHDSTTVNVYCTNVVKVYTVNEGGFFNKTLRMTDHCAIYSDKIILVVQLSHGGFEDSEHGDPMMTLVPATNQYLNKFDFVTIRSPLEFSDFTHHVNIIVMAQYYQPNLIYLIAGGTNNSLDTQQWTPIQVNNITEAYATQLTISDGIVQVFHTNASAQMMTIMYGFDFLDGYGHIGGLGIHNYANRTQMFAVTGISVRLAGGDSYKEGRVEVNYNGEWGTVCDDGWDETDAGVVCRQLGFGSSGQSLIGAYFGKGKGPIWLNNVVCTGSESTLASCGHLGVNLTKACNHDEDAAVKCHGAQEVAIRLVGGSSYNEGRVEVNYNGEWGTVCDDGWDNTDAGVVCRQLGFESSGTAIGSAGFGQGSGSIWLDSVTCTGNESALASCGHLGFNITRFCSHHEDAGVRCKSRQGHFIRLVGGSSHKEGRVEVNYNGEWGTVCDDGWDDTDAGVVCRQLGFGSSGTAIGSAGFGQGSGSIWLDGVICTGNESTLASCGHLGVRNCSHSRDASVVCNGNFNFPIRVPSGTSRTGRVEILNNGQWGLVCADDWDERDAIVVCWDSKLGNNGTAIMFPYNQTEMVWLSEVDCKGNESQFSLCPHNGIGVMDGICTFIAGVSCFVSPPSVTVYPKNITAKIYERVTFVCNTTGYGEFSFSWEHDGVIIAASNSNVLQSYLIVDPVLPQHRGHYKCTVTSLFSNITSNAFATLYLGISPITVTINPNIITAKVFGSVTIVCHTTTTIYGNFSFVWEHDGLVISISNSTLPQDILNIDSVMPQHQGQYKCTVTTTFSNLSVNSDAFAMLNLNAPSFDSQSLLQQVTSNASANTITVSIPPIDDSGGPISHYYIVVSMEQLENTEAVKDSELLPANPVKRNAELPLYVTASVNYEDFHQNFTIGDGSSSTDPILQTTFHNVPLQKQQTYYYFIRAYSAAHTREHPFFGTSLLSSPIMISANISTTDAFMVSSSSNSLPVVLGTVIPIFVISAIIIFVMIIIIVIKKKGYYAKRFVRDRSNSFPNPLYSVNIEATNKEDEILAGQVYNSIDHHGDKDDKEKAKPNNTVSSSANHNFLQNVNDSDHASIKSDDVSYVQSGGFVKENGEHCSKSKSLPKPVNTINGVTNIHSTNENLSADEADVSLDATQQTKTEEFSTQPVLLTTENNECGPSHVVHNMTENSQAPSGYATN